MKVLLCKNRASFARVPGTLNGVTSGSLSYLLPTFFLLRFVELSMRGNSCWNFLFGGRVVSKIEFVDILVPVW